MVLGLGYLNDCLPTQIAARPLGSLDGGHLQISLVKVASSVGNQEKTYSVADAATGLQNSLLQGGPLSLKFIGISEAFKN